MVLATRLFGKNMDAASAIFYQSDGIGKTIPGFGRSSASAPVVAEFREPLAISENQ